MNIIKKQLLKDEVMTPEQLNRLDAFVELFSAYNRHTNLSAIRQADDIWVKHIADSLIVMKFEKLNGTVLDLGTGGGLPGIPLAITQNNVQFSLLDSVGKKIRACEYFAKKLALTNIQTVHDRAEKLAENTAYAGKYNLVLSRAVAYLPVLLAWCKPFLAPGGKIVLYKTPSGEELKDGNRAAKKLKLHLETTHTYQLANQQRQLLVYKTLAKQGGSR